MSVTIRTRRVDGHEDSERYDTETAGRAALQRGLDAHRRLGHTVTPNGSRTLFTVKDKNGVFLLEAEIVRSA